MKKLIISLVVAMALIGAVYGAAAGLTIGGVDDLGSASVAVDNPSAGSVNVTDVTWTIDAMDVTLVDDAKITLTNMDMGSETCTVYANVRSGGAMGNIEFGGAATEGAQTMALITDTQVYTVGTNQDEPASGIDYIDITVTCET